MSFESGTPLILRRLFAEPFYRLAHAEADQVPGLVVDRCGGSMAVLTSSLEGCPKKKVRTMATGYGSKWL
jgi:23S rRNA G2069 N7-methylase RlmK/C1962 C5-methylase RlmI